MRHSGGRRREGRLLAPDGTGTRSVEQALTASAASVAGGTASRGVGVTLLSQGGRFVLQIASLAVLARLLTPVDFGLVAMATAILGVAEIVRDFGLSSAAIQAGRLTDKERTNLFWANLGIGIVCTAVTAASSSLIAMLYDRPELVGITLSMSWLFIVSGANTQFRAELSRAFRFTALAITDISAQFAGASAGITAAALGLGYWSIVVQQIVFVLTTCSCNVLSCKWRPTFPQRTVSIRRFFRFGAGLLGMQMLGYTTNNVDTVAVGAVLGAGPVGFYSRAYQLLMVPLAQIGNAMLRVMLPVMSRSQDDKVAYSKYIRQSQLLCGYGLGLAYAMAAGLSAPIVRLLFGNQWSGVAPIFALLAVGGIFRGLSQTTYWITLSRGLIGVQLRFYLVARPLMIATILAGLPWGVTGVAAGHSAAFVIEWAASLWWVGRAAGIDWMDQFRTGVRTVLVVCLPAGLISFVTTFIPGPPVVAIIAAVLGVAVLLTLLYNISNYEKSNFRLLVGSLRRSVGGK